MRTKPQNMKYTDLCIYIDKKVYERDENGNPIALRKLNDEETIKVYNYLYALIYALSMKKRLFNSKDDYDLFCIEATTDIFVRLEKPDQDFTYQCEHNKPIKSILNYVKGALAFMAMTWRASNYAEILKPESEFEDNEHEGVKKLENKRQAIKKYLYEQASADYSRDKSEAYTELLNNIPCYIKKSLENSIYKNNKLKKHQILLSEYITISNCLTLDSKKNKYSDEKKKKLFLEQLQNMKDMCIIFSDDKMITKDILDIEIKKSFMLLHEDADKINSDLTPTDQEISDILVSAFPTYDTDQIGEY
jgi:hypothetical protein